MECKKCGSKNLKVVDSGPHKKLVCADCLAFQTFLSKAEARTFEQLQKAKAADEGGSAESSDTTVSGEDNTRTCATCVNGYMETMGICSNPFRHYPQIEHERGGDGNCGPNGAQWTEKTKSRISSAQGA